jgi:transposase-like protein
MSSELSAKQTQAALLLARGDTITTAAEQIGVNRMTIQQWLKKDDNFNAYLNSLKREFVDAGRSAMRASIVTAIDTINQLMLSSTNDVVRLNAAKEILDRAGLANDKPIGSDDVSQLQQERNFGFSF